MHCHSPLGKLVCKLSWLLTAIGAILWGLIPFGFDFWKSDFVVNNIPWIVTPALYIVGIAGVLSLIGFFKHCADKHACPEETGRPYNR
ncbi:MAG: hypothetical protein ACOYT8_05140 [Candidatus Dependentiae bacterium]